MKYKVIVFGMMEVMFDQGSSFIEAHREFMFDEIPMLLQEVTCRWENDLPSSMRLESVDFCTLYSEGKLLAKGVFQHGRITWSTAKDLSDGDYEAQALLVKSMRDRHAQSLRQGQSSLASTLSLHIAALEANLSLQSCKEKAFLDIFIVPPEPDEPTTRH